MTFENKTIRTVALRFSDNFAPPEGTISAHSSVIETNGAVWYGKLGAALSEKITETILSINDPRILLIHSGRSSRYWAFVSRIQRETPDTGIIPAYYRNIADKFGCWFLVKRITQAPSNVMSQCTVVSSGELLSNVSKHSMSPYFIIEYAEEVEG